MKVLAKILMTKFKKMQQIDQQVFQLHSPLNGFLEGLKVTMVYAALCSPAGKTSVSQKKKSYKKKARQTETLKYSTY